MDEPIRISAVPIQQAKLTFCDGSLGGLEAWAQKLPLANVGVSAKMLFQAIRELNSTQFKTPQRYQMLELLRTPIYDICQLLSKRILKQAVTLSDNDIKIVTLTQTLQAQLAAGYKRIVLDEIAAKRKTPQKVLTFAIHRAISDLSQTVLRSFQLYSPAPTNAWLELHQLYDLAQNKEIHQYSVKDNRAQHSDGSTITEAYSRILLLGCCKPNQLRQVELSQLYAATELWTSLVKLTPSEDVHSLFIILPNKDFAPVYRSLVKQTQGHKTRGLLPKTLVMALQKHLNKDVTTISVPQGMQPSLIEHVIHAWGDLVERSFRRNDGNGEIDLAIGLSSSHFFSANEKSFSFLLDEWNIELSEKKPMVTSEDVWDQSFDAGNATTADAENIAFDSIAFIKQHAEHQDVGPKSTFIQGKIIDTSPGGYGVYVDNPPSSIQTGELIAIRESAQSNWSIASIRWIRSQPKKPTQLGIELIAPNAQPVAVRILNKTGENGEFLRGLLLSALPTAGQDETLILPTIPFKVGCKAELVDSQSNQRIQLLGRQKLSRSFVQYSFQSISQALQSKPQKSVSDDDEFASIWDKL